MKRQRLGAHQSCSLWEVVVLLFSDSDLKEQDVSVLPESVRRIAVAAAEVF